MKVIDIKLDSVEDLEEILTKLLKELNNKAEETEEETEEQVEKEPTIMDFIEIIADKKGWKLERTDYWLGNIAELSESAAFNIILKEIAIYLDKKYNDHISKSDKIFVLSMLDGEVYETNKGKIKSYKNFAAFRTYEDAMWAKQLMQPVLNGMFDAK